MEKKIKKEIKKVTKKAPKQEKKLKENKIEKKKKEESYFIALLKKRDLIFASWKIDAPVWIKKIETAEKDPSINKQYLYIDISSIENGKYVKIDSIPVHGLENNWHIFVKNEYCGKRILLSLSYRDKKGKFFDILISEEIDIPYSIESIQSSENFSKEENILLELSEIKLAGLSGSESTSW